VQHEIRVRGVNHQTRRYTWENNDRLRAIVDSLSGPVHYTHDALGNLAAATYQDGRVDLRLPDAVGNLFKTADQSDRKYGPAGQLLEAHGPRGTTHYAYDAEGNLSKKTEPDGKEWCYRWSLTGMLSAVERPDGDVVTFAYDALGRRITKTYRGKTTNWIWDGNVPLHEWIELTEEARARDGEPLKTSFEREIAQAKRKAHLSRRTAQGPPELVYPTLDGGAPGKAGPETPGAGQPGASNTRYADAPLLEGTPESPITWLFEPESFSPLGKLVDDERYSIITDHLGTPRAMFDAHGQEAWAAELDTYGQLREVRGGRKACPFRFPGQYEDPETGLYYNRFRYYDPEVGGYVSQDPIGLAGGANATAYTPDPNSWIDPYGLSGTCATQAASWQGSGSYPGDDHWRDITLKKGTIIYGGVPGQSEFYTTARSLERAAGSRSALGRALQISPHAVHGYRPAVGAYVVTQDTPAAIAVTRANSHLGPGGATQFFVPDFANSLSPLQTIPLGP
jgi:RHS repeat-associated protein